MTNALKQGWVYLVEDSEVARLHAAACLRQLGWRVFSFPDVARCLEALRSYTPEALVIDLGLPDGSGVVLAGRLVRRHRMDGIRLVAYTALGGDERGLLLASGFADVIAKPGPLADFARALPLLAASQGLAAARLG